MRARNRLPRAILAGMTDRWRIAVHEAGHAVAGRALGLPCGGASADPACAHADVPIDVSVASVIVLMSGAIGERLILGDCVGGWDDCVRWTSALDATGYDDEALWAYTTELLAPHLDAVVRDVVEWLAFLLGGCRTCSFASSHASHSVVRQWFRLTSGCPSASMRKR